ncbi:MAG: polyphosphate:AMP phosphotransferase [Gammaproteobacteria bacterium]|nr:polyphosphate:AMP phosphotransferase [Gammaproteobacteria bacterium]
MFESAELDQKISKEEFARREPEIRTRLLQAQQRIQKAGLPVLILLAGVEGADRSGVVKRLNEWLDPRYLRTHAFWDETDEERQRPYYWRFWRCLPARGETAIMFGSWYTRPIIDRVFDHMDDNTFELSLQTIKTHEQMLADDNHIIIKLWFHLSSNQQQERLAEKKRAGKSPTASLFKKFAKHYVNFLNVSERALRSTDTASNPWHIIEAGNRRFRDLTAAEIIAHRLETALEKPRPAGVVSTLPTPAKNLLMGVDLSQSLPADSYVELLKKYQKKLAKQVWQAKDQARDIVLLFEGWDAAGKGGAIRRITQSIDARLYKVIPVAAPSDEEKAHHYLWRFWRHIPRNGYITIYDRSWYGRVLVERVEGFARADEWQRAYQEMNHFEQQLTQAGTVLLKFWLHISPEEQLKRFKEREVIPWKKHKITEEDWRNREKWSAYELAVHDMISKTSTQSAPWTLIAGNNKSFGRIQVLQTVTDTLDRTLGD